MGEALTLIRLGVKLPRRLRGRSGALVLGPRCRDRAREVRNGRQEAPHDRLLAPTCMHSDGRPCFVVQLRPDGQPLTLSDRICY